MVDSLDFGLFSARPRLCDLINQSMPIIWVSLVSLWPGLLSGCLRMVWCVPIPEDDVIVSRLLPHPSVVCWSRDHWASAGLAIAGLAVWCLGIPVTLAIRLLCLPDRQAPENFRRVATERCRGPGKPPKPWAWQALRLLLPGSGAPVLVVGPRHQALGHGLRAPHPSLHH